MGLFDFFKKSQENEIFCYDKLDYHYKKAIIEYFKVNKLPDDTTITSEMKDEIMVFAVNHIALMIMWIAERGFCNKEEYQDDTDICFEEIRTGELSSTEFVLEFCNGEFLEEDVTSSVRPFMKEYYMNSYWNDYVEFITSELYSLPYQVNCTTEDYHKFAPKINKAYEMFLSR